MYLRKMYSGQWGGTMVLTEPEAGSDVGALTTTAVKNDDGTYSISGNKIFITAAEHDMTENIVHPVLARIEGAPAGTERRRASLQRHTCDRDIPPRCPAEESELEEGRVGGPAAPQETAR